MTQEELDSLLADLDNELPVNPQKQASTATDTTVDDFGRTSDLPIEGFAYNAVKDVGTKLGQWWEGGKAGLAEAQRAAQQLPDMSSAEVPGGAGLTEENQQSIDYNNNAAMTFLDQTLKPVSYAAGVVSPIMALPALAADAGSVIKEEIGKGNTYAPNVAGALAAKFSGAEAVAGAIKEPAAFGTKAYNEPITTAMELLPAALTGALAYKGIRGMERGEKPTGKLETAELETLANELPDVAEQVKDIEPPAAPVESAPRVDGNNILTIGEEQLGKPYELGADGTNSTDCGLFTQQTLGKAGVELDYRTADGQYRQLETEGKTFASEAEAQPGDLVFFDVPSNRDRWTPSDNPAAVNSDGQAYKGVTHVGIYAGEGKVLQAGSRGVSYADINDFGDIVGFGKTGEGGKVTRGIMPREEEPSAVRDVERGIDEDIRINEDIAAKEPWEMTQEEFNKTSKEEPIIDTTGKETTLEQHKQIVEQAISEDKPVPKEVIEEYPDLVEKYPEKVAAIRQSKVPVSYDASVQGSLGNKETVPTSTTYDKPVTRQEIIKDINDLVISRTGKIGNSKFDGIYKTNKDVIRSRNYGDFDTYAHEIGHYIDKQFAVKGHEQELIAAADGLWGNNKTYQGYNPAQKRAEGIAEFGRQYLLNPAEAQKTFPGYYKDFISKLSENRDISRKLNNISGKMRAWFSQSAEARGRGSVSFAKDDYTTVKSKAKNAAYKAYEAFFDDKVELSRFTAEIEKQLGEKLEFEQNPYKKARLVQNSALARAEMLVSDSNPELVQATLNKLYNGKIKYAVTIKDIFDGLNAKELKTKYPEYLKQGNFESWQQAFSTLLVVRRQRELQALKPEYKGPISKPDAAKIMADAPKELQDLAQKFYQYNDNLLAIAEDGGLISKDTLATLRDKYQNYAPMMRDFADETAMTDAFSTGKKIGNVSNPLKKLTEEGSTRSVIDPLENTIKNTYTLLNAVERNKVAQTFIELDKKTDIGRFIESVPGGVSDAKKSIFTVMIDGKKQAFQTTPEFYRAIMSMNQQSAGMLISIFKPFAQALRVGATISPDFIVRNLIRDTLTAGIYSETGFKPVLDTVKGAKSLLTDKELAYEFKASGAPLSAFVGLDRSNVGGILDKMGGGGEWRKYNPATYVKSVYEGMRKVSEAAESGTRIREFERARQQGKSIEEAGLLAKDVTLDFSRSGSIGRQINQAIPFFNAVLQGGDRLVRAFKDNPQRTTAFVFAYITLPSIANWIINHDQDWYKELPDDVKNASWVFNTNGTIIRVPKPFEPGVIFGSSIERALDQMYNKDKDAVKQWVKYAAAGFLPSLMPTLIGPIIEWITNYNFFTDRPIVGKKEESLPNEMQYNAFTSELAKGIGSATGLSPLKIDNTIAGYTASAGKFVVSSMDNIIGNPKQLPAKTTSELPGIRGLTYTPFKNPQSVEDFYNKLEEVEKNYNAVGKKGNPPTEVKRMRRYSEEIKDLNKDNRDITNNDKLTPEQKRQKIDANAAKILQKAKKAIE